MIFQIPDSPSCNIYKYIVLKNGERLMKNVNYTATDLST